MSLFKPSYCFLPIYPASLPKLEISAFHSLFSRLRAAAAKKIVWTSEALLKILEQMPIWLFSVFYSKKAELFMWIVCPANDSHVMSYLICPVICTGKYGEKKWKCCLLNVLSASRITGGLKEYGYISFDMGDRNRQAEMYLHYLDQGLVVIHDNWTRVRAGQLNHQ